MGDETGVVKSISELAFWVKDLDRSVAFYRDRLGFAVEEIDHREAPHPGILNAPMRVE